MQPDRESASYVILCLNSGSSSLNFALYRLGEVVEVQLARGANGATVPGAGTPARAGSVVRLFRSQ